MALDLGCLSTSAVILKLSLVVQVRGYYLDQPELTHCFLTFTLH